MSIYNYIFVSVKQLKYMVMKCAVITYIKLEKRLIIEKDNKVVELKKGKAAKKTFKAMQNKFIMLVK